MKKKTVLLMFLILSLILWGCQKQNETKEDTEHEEMIIPESEKNMTEYTYSEKEIYVQNDDKRIYGVAYVPDTEKRVPLVIFSHELGNDHSSGERYAQRFAQAGYAAYVFDFCGGTVGGNRSDGSNSELSVLTEASDLDAVLNEAKSWDFVDKERIVLLGGSMGGLVSIVEGTRRQDEIAGMILMYPALSAKQDSGIEKYADKSEVPEDVSLFGGWIHVGKNFVTDLWDLNFDEMLSSYRGPVLLMHGDKDDTVPLSYSDHAAELIPDCEYHVIKNGGHEFFGQPFEDAMSYILPYLEKQVGENREEEKETVMEMKIADTFVEVEWEDNESVEALRELCQDTPLSISMSIYGGFEQVGSIGQSLPRNDVQTVTDSGDIVLYSGNQIVVFYGSNSWAYTRLGHIVDKNSEEMKDLLSNGDVTITIGYLR